MTFTVINNPIVDDKIWQDLKYIRSKLLSHLGDYIHSILLCGGFGRGEGSIILKNDKIHVVNDYDFTIAINSKSPFHYAKLYKQFHSPLEELAQKIANRLEMKQVDFSLKPLSYFRKPSLLQIENYEVKKGHVLIYGKDDPTNTMPDWKASDIPLFEGTWLFRNRGAGMLIAALYILDNKKFPIDKRENFVIECIKAQIAIGDSILLLNGIYHHQYKERLKRIDQIDDKSLPNGKFLLKNYREALYQKLNPDFDKFYIRDFKLWWFDISELLCSFYQFFESKRLHHNFDNWIDYTKLLKFESDFELKTFVSKMIRRSTKMVTPQSIKQLFIVSRKSFTISIIPLLLFSFTKDGFNGPYMEAASTLLGQPIHGNNKSDWINLTKTFLKEVHPGGEVAKILK